MAVVAGHAQRQCLALESQYRENVKSAVGEMSEVYDRVDDLERQNAALNDSLLRDQQTIEQFEKRQRE